MYNRFIVTIVTIVPYNCAISNMDQWQFLVCCPKQRESSQALHLVAADEGLHLRLRRFGPARLGMLRKFRKACLVDDQKGLLYITV